MSTQSLELVNVTPGRPFAYAAEIAKEYREKSESKRLGRPKGSDTYTIEIADEICARLSEGVPLAEICRDSDMPGWTTVYSWEQRYPDFSERVVRARDHGHDAIAARMRHTARGKTRDEGGDSSGDVTRDKLIIDTDLKLLEKWSNRYAQKKTHEITGALAVTQTQAVDVSKLSIEQQEAIRQVCLMALSDNAKVIEGSATSDDPQDLC